MKRYLAFGFVLAVLAAGCAGTGKSPEVTPEPVVRVPAGDVAPGMSRQDVIVSLGPPMLVTRKSGQDTEFLVYHVPVRGRNDGERVPLYIAIDEGKVSATGSAADFGFDQ